MRMGCTDETRCKSKGSLDILFGHETQSAWPDGVSLRHENAMSEFPHLGASHPETQEEVLVDVALGDEWHLVLFNDHHNTFDHVIECLMHTCGHDALQAEQCAMIVHFKGKCTVKSGSLDELTPMHRQLSERDLTVELNP